ncbi:polyglutamine-binding protein 1 isoform X1 [Procambarus clarkii]|uniref:polyglutamine-binding protein 1 isoform X1 n=1 Tax=Procambarus clarkii TaxID=6728 RepID=UPI001E674A38|nr:polyglutamine-binding protein 1-like isoform X1 [Procambarus clarkii]
MPLPPALAAKLAKRGIINIPKEPAVFTEPEAAASAEEEIIAEDYDETPQQTSLAYTPVESQIVDPYMGFVGCPNKWNVYHECGSMCREQWKERKVINPDYDRRRIRMLNKYPLPNHWQEILDPGICRYYYWNTETDLVSWLPPGHPRCQVSRSAATLRKEMATEISKNRSGGSENEGEMVGVEEEDDQDGDDHMSDKSEGSGDESSQREKRESDRRERNRDKGRERDRGRDRRGRRHPPSEELDPMDPASYGECGRGTWASGLPQRNEARTGADVTASGPLFQMRPYPSPGAVLRANAAAGPIGPKKT